MKQILKLKIIIFTAIFLFLASSAFAAEIKIDGKSGAVQPGEQFIATIFLKGGGNVNALEGRVIFPTDLLELKEIRDGNSIVNFWIERPKIEDNEIFFSGITPGGFQNENSLIFSVVFQARQEGRGSVEIREVTALLNDGKGTATDIATSNLQFIISEKASVTEPVVVEKKDIEMPEIFEPIVTSDPSIFDGKYFLIFITPDKGSGIDYYEVCEGKRKCVVAETPYLLLGQDLNEKITVKAVDKSGNERIAIIPPQKTDVQYKKYLIFAILIIVVVLYFLGKILWKKRQK